MWQLKKNLFLYERGSKNGPTKSWYTKNFEMQWVLEGKTNVTNKESCCILFFFIVFSSQGYIHGEVGIKNLVFKGVKPLEFEKEKKKKK